MLVCVLTAHAARAQVIGTAGGAAGAPAGRGAITVRVLDDANQPVRNAVVMAFSQGRPGRSTHMNFDNTASREGRYVVGGLDPGLYSISASVPGYVQEQQPLPADFEQLARADRRSLYRPGESVTLRMVKGGVITGRVTDSEGNPVVGARVAAYYVRYASGRPVPSASSVRERRTDDRGIYRLYGLDPGTYVVFAGGRPEFNGTRPTPYDADAPTFYPSATRDGASEVQVQAGQEMTDVDIRYRGEKGHSVAGTLVGIVPTSGGRFSGVSLTHSATGAIVGRSYVQTNAPASTFSFDAVPDGEYELTATTSTSDEGSLVALPMPVSVHGADVSGLRLSLVALGSLAGRVAFEPLKSTDAARAECQRERSFVPQEMLLVARREGTDTQRRAAFSSASAAPEQGGDFTLRNLREGRLRLGVTLSDDDYYVRALTMPAASVAPANGAAPTTNAAPAAGTTTATKAATAANATAANARGATPATVDLARNTFALRAGEKLSGAVVTVAAGAASLRGRVVAAAEGEAVPDGLRVYLVPSERERAEDVLRYAETDVQPDGSFAFKNLAPGSYLLLARPAPEGEQQRRTPLGLDAEGRAALRRDAEAAKNAVALQPCQRAEDFTLRLARP